MMTIREAWDNCPEGKSIYSAARPEYKFIKTHKQPMPMLNKKWTKATDWKIEGADNGK